MGYTYLIGWTRLGTWYYGVRFAKGCSLDDLWAKYFTSSNRVKKFRETYGEPDVVEIRQVFNDKLSAQNWESRLLRRIKAVKSPHWLNANDTFRYDFDVTPELLAKRRAGIKAHWDSMDVAAREARVAKRMAAWRASYDTMDMARREAFKEMSRRKIAAVNAGDAATRLANSQAGQAALKARINAMSEEERQEYFQKQTKSRVKTFSSMTNDQKASWSAKKAKTQAAKTPEEKATFKLRMSAIKKAHWEAKRLAGNTTWSEEAKARNKATKSPT